MGQYGLMTDQRRRSGDGFMRGSDGYVRWGIFGAAGVVFVTISDGDVRVMLQKRSAWSHEGGTWSCAGGALDEGETPYAGAMREAAEEIGTVPEHRVLGECVFSPATDWSYTTIVAEVAEVFGGSMNFETDAVEWITLDDVGSRSLHAGFAAAWPTLHRLIRDASLVPPSR
jgi:8-oxo-dGTP diphosphatase